MIRVAFITHYTSLYGANRSLLNLIDGLSAYEVSSHVISPSLGDITHALRERQVPVECIPVEYWTGVRQIQDNKESRIVGRVRKYISWRLSTARRLYRNVCSLPALIRQLKSWDVDVVYTNTSVTPIGAMAACMLRRPHIWHLREFEDLHYGRSYDWGKKLSKEIIRRADAKISISRAVQAYFLDTTESECTYVIYNGVASKNEFDQLYSRAESHLGKKSTDPYTFAIVGLIHPSKGQETAIRALSLIVREHADVRLLIVGEGDRGQLDILASALGVRRNIEIWGHINDPYRAYFSADAILMCSRYEGMGRVTVEAMSACRPVIGNDSGGTAELIQDGHTGLLYHESPEELANCMKQLIENPKRGRRLGRNGWYIARQRYNTELYAERVYEVLSTVVRRA